MPPATLDYSPRPEFDTGRFVARYLQALAWTSIAAMVAAPVFFDAVHVDLSPVLLFWAASALKRRSRAARVWVVALAGATVVGLVAVLARAAVAGTGGTTLSLGVRTIEDPALWQVALATVSASAAAAVPLVVLLSGRARRQFGGGAREGDGGSKVDTG